MHKSLISAIKTVQNKSRAINKLSFKRKIVVEMIKNRYSNARIRMFLVRKLNIRMCSDQFHQVKRKSKSFFYIEKVTRNKYENNKE